MTDATKALFYKMLLAAIVRKYGRNNKLILSPADMEGIQPFALHAKPDGTHLFLTYEAKPDEQQEE